MGNLRNSMKGFTGQSTGFVGISARKLKSGTKYRFQVSYRGEKYSSPSIYDTAVQAELAKREKLIEMEMMYSQAESQPLALSEITRRRLQDLQIKRSAKYVYNTEKLLEKAVEGLGAKTAVTSITKPQIISLLNKEAERLQSEGKDLYTVNHLLATLKALFNYVIEDLCITMINPCVGIKLYAVSRKQKYIPPHEHIMRVREQLEPYQRNLIDFLIQTGSRISSALWLTVDSIKWKTKRVALFTSKSRHGDHAPYLIPIPDILYDMRSGGSLPKSGTKGSSGRVFHQWVELHNPVFLARTIDRINSKKIESEWGNEFIPKFGFHSLRHRAATLWANSKMSMREVQLRLGHSSITTTEIYISKLLGYNFTHYEDDIFTEW